MAEFLISDMDYLWSYLGGVVRSRFSSSKTNTNKQTNASSNKNQINNTSSHSNPHSVSYKYNGFYFLYTMLFPIFILYGIRIVTRNQEWQSEYRIYQSALDVCPNSVKALNNYAVLSLKYQEYARALSMIEHSIELYPGHAHAYLNAGTILYVSMHLSVCPYRSLRLYIFIF